MEQAKPAGHRTDMRISLSDKSLRYEVKRPPAFPVAVALVSCLGLSACAGKQPNAWQQDKQIVVTSIKHLQAEQQSMKDAIARLQKRTVDLENTQTTQTSMLDAQHTSIRQLQTSTMHLGAMAAKSKKSSRITKQKLVKKIDKIAKTISKPVISLPSQVKEEEKNSYTAAYLALKSGRYDKAAEGFRHLLKKFPKGEYADQAWYWLGESYYAQHNIKQTIHAFETVVRHYPKSPKHAAALLKLGLVYQDAARTKNATSTWQRLIREHPDSAAAEQARRQLKNISKRNR